MDAHQLPLDDAARADNPSLDERRGDGVHEVAPDLAYKRLAMVNVALVGPRKAGDRNWVLVDAGVPLMAGAIAESAEKRFGRDARPAAIVMTHAHFDHFGSLKELADRWDAPIYAHAADHPYMDGTANTPPPDPGVGGGILPTLSPLFPRGPVNVSDLLNPLPMDGTVPGMPGWMWVHTPGHTPGHVSFFRPEDRALIAGDAFITTNQESAYAVATQEIEMHGPPTYFTQDWTAARESVRRLAALAPEVAICGHGRAVRGEALRRALSDLAEHFDAVAVPESGKYVKAPTRPEDGSAYPPAK